MLRAAQWLFLGDRRSVSGVPKVNDQRVGSWSVEPILPAAPVIRVSDANAAAAPAATNDDSVAASAAASAIAAAVNAATKGDSAAAAAPAAYNQFKKEIVKKVKHEGFIGVGKVYMDYKDKIAPLHYQHICKYIIKNKLPSSSADNAESWLSEYLVDGMAWDFGWDVSKAEERYVKGFEAYMEERYFKLHEEYVNHTITQVNNTRRCEYIPNDFVVFLIAMGLEDLRRPGIDVTPDFREFLRWDEGCGKTQKDRPIIELSIPMEKQQELAKEQQRLAERQLFKDEISKCNISGLTLESLTLSPAEREHAILNLWGVKGHGSPIDETDVEVVTPTVYAKKDSVKELIDQNPQVVACILKAYLLILMVGAEDNVYKKIYLTHTDIDYLNSLAGEEKFRKMVRDISVQINEYWSGSSISNPSYSKVFNEINDIIEKELTRYVGNKFPNEDVGRDSIKLIVQALTKRGVRLFAGFSLDMYSVFAMIQRLRFFMREERASVFMYPLTTHSPSLPAMNLQSKCADIQYAGTQAMDMGGEGVTPSHGIAGLLFLTHGNSGPDAGDRMDLGQDRGNELGNLLYDSDSCYSSL